MADRCGGISSGSRTSSASGEDACTLSREDAERAKMDAERSRMDRDRQAAAALDARLAEHPTVIGSTEKNGTCSTRSAAPVSKDWRTPEQREAARTAQLAKPLEDDVVGNAMVGALAGGLVEGIGEALAGSGARVALKAGADGVAKDFVKHVSFELTAEAAREGKHPSPASPSIPAASAETSSASPSSPPPSSGGVGKCGSDASSKPVSAPDRCDASPAAPRPPLAPPADPRATQPMSIQG